MKLIYIAFISLFFFSCASNNQIPTEKSEAGLFSKDKKKGIKITDFLNKDEMDDSSFYVNSFLWRASLDVLSIAPFQSADSFGGLIVTEWFKKDNKEIKLTAIIKSKKTYSYDINTSEHNEVYLKLRATPI